MTCFDQSTQSVERTCKLLLPSRTVGLAGHTLESGLSRILSISYLSCPSLFPRPTTTVHPAHRPLRALHRGDKGVRFPLARSSSLVSDVAYCCTTIALDKLGASAFSVAYVGAWVGGWAFRSARVMRDVCWGSDGTDQLFNISLLGVVLWVGMEGSFFRHGS